jgi:hypothetical protein
MVSMHGLRRCLEEVQRKGMTTAAAHIGCLASVGSQSRRSSGTALRPTNPAVPSTPLLRYQRLQVAARADGRQGASLPVHSVPGNPCQVGLLPAMRPAAWCHTLRLSRRPC